MALILETDRLLLRNWEEQDFGPYHAMNNDPVVCEYFPTCRRKRSPAA